MEYLSNYNHNAVHLVKFNTPLIPENHFMSKTLNKSMHPIPKEFFQLGNTKVLEIYCELNPKVDKKILEDCLNYESKYYHWGAADLFHVKAANTGKNKMVLVEMNSVLGGLPTAPGKNLEAYEGERRIYKNFFNAVSTRCDPKSGGLALIYDAYYIRLLGRAALLANTAKENIWMVEYSNDDKNPPLKWVDGLMHIRDPNENSKWHPIRACFISLKYKPWTKIPFNSKTLIMNNILADLCGARNKNIATHAYEIFNQELLTLGSGLKIDTPKTIRNVKKNEIQGIIEGMGGKAAVKVPYSSGGHGVFTILNQSDFNKFMESKNDYENYIVQYLVTPFAWNADICNQDEDEDQYFHVGTQKEGGKSYVNDLRMILTSGKNGFSPVAIVSRRARDNIEFVSDPAFSTWEILGTNIVQSDGRPIDFKRVMICDEEEFPKYNMDLSDLINAYVQSVLGVIAIDKLCQKCVTQDMKFDLKLFQFLNDDNELLTEILK